MSPKPKSGLPSPWAEFFAGLDRLLTEEIRLHCIGGFVVSIYYGLARPTADVDYFSVQPHHCANHLDALAGAGSALAQKHKVHLQHVTVNNMPEDYADRIVEMYAGCFKKLRLFAPEAYDLILSKMERNSPKDRDDVEYLAKTLHLDPKVLEERYKKELRPYLAAVLDSPILNPHSTIPWRPAPTVKWSDQSSAFGRSGRMRSHTRLACQDSG